MSRTDMDQTLGKCIQEANIIVEKASYTYETPDPLMRTRDVCLYLLGAGGGDFIQRTPVVGGLVARTGGFGIMSLGTHLLVDPGPDCMYGMQACGVDAKHLDGIVITHRHVDHFADWEFAVARMSRKGAPMFETGQNRHGVLLATKAFLQGEAGAPPIATEFYLDRLERAEIMIPGKTTHSVGSATIHCRTAYHVEVQGIPCIPSIDVDVNGYYIIYLSDGEYRHEIVEERVAQPYYRTPDILIANIQTLAAGARSTDDFTPNQLGLRGLVEVIRRLSPRLTVVRSWGLETIVEESEGCLKPAPWKLDLYKTYLESETGCEITIPGTAVLEMDASGWETREVCPALGGC